MCMISYYALFKTELWSLRYTVFVSCVAAELSTAYLSPFLLLYCITF
jgi:hypothetical protein